MVLFVDKLEKYGIGGFTTDLRKIEYILAVFNTDFDEIINKTGPKAKTPSRMFIAGRYVVLMQLAWDKKEAYLGFFHYEVEIDKHFDACADFSSPKAIQMLHTLKEKIKSQSEELLNKFELYDDELSFEIAFQNYKAFLGHQC